MEVVYVLVYYHQRIPMYYCGYYKNNKPAISSDFNASSVFLNKESAEIAKGIIKGDFEVEEHSY